MEKEKIVEEFFFFVTFWVIVYWDKCQSCQTPIFEGDIDEI